MLPAGDWGQRLLEVSARRVACGVDVVELPVFSRCLELGGERLLRRIYTPAERAWCRGRADRLAARFAAKEAIAKALGTGIRGVSWTEMEVLSAPNGEPRVVLKGRAKQLAEALGLRTWAISLSHTRRVAVSYVVALQDEGGRLSSGARVARRSDQGQ